MCKHLTAILFVALIAAGCKGPTDPSKNTTETLGPNTVAPQMLDVKVLNVQNTGEYTVKLTALSPGGVFVGVAWGQSDGTNCAPIQSNPALSNANIGRTILSGSILIKGPYCVVVFDPYATLGTASWPVAQTYTLEVSHP